MANASALPWIKEGEEIVAAPGIVDICWMSDDPLYARPSTDLYFEQDRGLESDYCKKDKKTGIQSYFRCQPCECDMKSIITLRHHCSGLQHINKTFKIIAAYKEKLKKDPQSKLKKDPEENNPEYDLYSVLDKQNKKIVGLRYITEFINPNGNKKPLYHCRLPLCQNAQGDAGHMSRHIFTVSHRAAWIQEDQKNDSLVKHEQVVSYVEEHFENLKEEYGQISQDESLENYSKIELKEFRRADKLPPIKRKAEEETVGGGGLGPLANLNIKRMKSDFDDDIAAPDQDDGQADVKQPLSEKEVERNFKWQIAHCVRSCLDTYYPGTEKYVQGNKALSKDDYSSLARQYINQFKKEIKTEY
eukprot:TRINITY_DN2653_c0_g1_i19.p1 TRINITY_DN2653_c0_g1~~TRINITY_DN2653_c0_g1_i19.p1  ORF type:complete len:359 (-),score=107.53 TRINITY_DN2653_c0_g1_i19:314-1390(-)